MIRTITVVSAFFLATISIVHAEDRGSSLPDLGYKPDQYQYRSRVDPNMSLEEYEEIYSHNQKFALKALMSYTNDTLESVGIPEQGINLMGAAIDFAVNGPRLDMNLNKSLSFELKDVDISDHALYFGVNLDW
jgi:hypothetical protein